MIFGVYGPTEDKPDESEKRTVHGKPTKTGRKHQTYSETHFGQSLK